MTYARDRLDQHLASIGMSNPTDVGQQYAISVLRQLLDHLEIVLTDEGVDAVLRNRIIREMIYGGVPTQAEAVLRDELAKEYTQQLSQGVIDDVMGHPGRGH